MNDYDQFIQHTNIAEIREAISTRDSVTVAPAKPAAKVKKEEPVAVEESNDEDVSFDF